ncbi:MAG: SAM-dependent methyltransferase [Puniceicoccales bacterium]|jgi:SAM-dependent MidA family methyltransferase|nr:SAM-dependent methyltransferase [Puniceicoccales bacterium]
MDSPSANSSIYTVLQEAASPAGVIDYGVFTCHALHHPVHGYYRRDISRVGKSDDTDFYTAASMGPLFGKLIRAAVTSLLGESTCQESTLVEIGAEPNQELFAGETSFFESVKTLRNGEPLVIPPKSIVFSNELLDAQPFHRLIFKNGKWRELGVRVNDHTLSECLLDDFVNEYVENFAASLPTPWHEDWIVDAPLGAEALLRELVQQSWTGALVFFDYGKTLAECLENSPEGTARAYRNHRMHNDLLASPGEQDLTCHVLWDRLEDILQTANFTKVRTDRQEAFFMRHATATIAEMLGSPDPGLERERSKLRELLHPAHFGHKFQVLHGIR